MPPQVRCSLHTLQDVLLQLKHTPLNTACVGHHEHGAGLCLLLTGSMLACLPPMGMHNTHSHAGAAEQTSAACLPTRGCPAPHRRHHHHQRDAASTLRCAKHPYSQPGSMHALQSAAPVQRPKGASCTVYQGAACCARRPAQLPKGAATVPGSTPPSPCCPAAFGLCRSLCCQPGPAAAAVGCIPSTQGEAGAFSCEQQKQERFVSNS
jgi:hypothetical protein